MSDQSRLADPGAMLWAEVAAVSGAKGDYYFGGQIVRKHGAPVYHGIEILDIGDLVDHDLVERAFSAKLWPEFRTEDEQDVVAAGAGDDETVFATEVREGWIKARDDAVVVVEVESEGATIEQLVPLGEIENLDEAVPGRAIRFEARIVLAPDLETDVVDVELPEIPRATGDTSNGSASVFHLD